MNISITNVDKDEISDKLSFILGYWTDYVKITEEYNTEPKVCFDKTRDGEITGDFPIVDVLNNLEVYQTLEIVNSVDTDVTRYYIKSYDFGYTIVRDGFYF